MDFAINLNPGGVGFHEPDLSAYASRGGKVIAYHGRVDQTITSKLATEYFSNVQASLNFTVDEMLDFYHLYLIPGHGHCRGGPGAWDIGQVYPMDQERLDEENNALLALAAWVEEGRVPKGLSGVKYEDDDVTKPILSQRSMSPSCSFLLLLQCLTWFLRALRVSLPKHLGQGGRPERVVELDLRDPAVKGFTRAHESTEIIYCKFNIAILTTLKGLD